MKESWFMKGEGIIPQKQGLQRREEEVYEELVAQHRRRFRRRKRRKRITETFPISVSDHYPAKKLKQLNWADQSQSEEERVIRRDLRVRRRHFFTHFFLLPLTIFFFPLSTLFFLQSLPLHFGLWECAHKWMLDWAARCEPL